MIIYNIAAALALGAAAQTADGLPASLSTSAIVPTILTLAPGPHDYGRFADGGPDDNWYIGFNNAWIVKLPPAPPGDFARAFIGARVGRAKTRPNAKKPWVRELIPGKVYIGLSQSPAWTSEQGFFLADTADIPAEPDPQSRVDGAGSAEWFWAEVPLAMVSFTQPNYLAVWSPTNWFTRASSAPIIAAADLENGAAGPRAWLNRSIMGVPPRSPKSALETPLNTLAPAIALKLVPPGPEEPAVTVSDLTLARAGSRALVRFSAAGEDLAEAWVETSRDQLEWARASRYLRRPPYQFTLPAEKTPAAGSFVRGAARDASGATGYSDAVMVPFAPR